MSKWFYDVAGQTFGGWTVICRIPREQRRDADLNRAWLCRCKCGRELTLSLGLLKRNSIGCNKCRKNDSYRIRPYESLYRTACKLISGTTRGTPRICEITYEQFVKLIEYGKCHYCWTPLRWAEYAVGKNGAAYQLDRKDNSQGYVLHNLVTCCWRCNQAKGSRFTYEEWWAMTKYFRESKKKSGGRSENPEQLKIVMG